MLGRSSKIALVVVISTAMLWIVGCPTGASIGDINRDPARFAGKEVAISGHASQTFGGLGNGVYQVDDGSGRMWVFSQNFGVPGNGAKVRVVGRVEQGFSFGGRSFGVILRQTERVH